MCLEHLHLDALKSRHGGAELHENIHAITLIIDHPLDTGQLALDPPQAGQTVRMTGVILDFRFSVTVTALRLAFGC